MCLLTTTAGDYFARHGFVQSHRPMTPCALNESAEFQGACPDTAVFMELTLALTSG